MAIPTQNVLDSFTSTESTELTPYATVWTPIPFANTTAEESDLAVQSIQFKVPQEAEQKVL